jgi:hypothetical protein
VIPDGFEVRGYTTPDIAVIVDSWRRSGLKPFMEGNYQPFPHLNNTIQTALKQKNVALLKRIYEAEIGKVMNRALDGNICVICDVNDPSIVFAWGCSAYRYVKQITRGIGLEEALEEILK